MCRDKGLLIAAILYLCASIYSAGHAANNSKLIKADRGGMAVVALLFPMIYWSIEIQRKSDD